MISIDSFEPYKWLEDRNLAEAEIPLDPRLPQLAQVLNTETMLRVFQEALPLTQHEDKQEICHCRIPFVRYKPTRYCYGYYYLDFERDSHRRTLLVAAKVYSKELSAKKITSVVSSLKVVPSHGVSHGYIPEIKMLFTFFPNDFAIHQLEDLFDTEKLKEIARDTPAFPFLFSDKTEDNKSSIKVMSYKPGRSCLIRWRSSIGRSSSDTQKKDFYVRIYQRGAGKIGESVQRAMGTLWKSEAKESNILDIAEPLGYRTKRNILIQGVVAGLPLASFVGEAAFINHIGATDRALAGIHKTPLNNPDEELIPLETELVKMAAMSQALTQVISGYSEKLRQLLSDLKRKAPAFNKNTTGFVPGDFSINQVLVDNKQVGVVDFDTASIGDQHADIATFLTRLEGDMSEVMRAKVAEAFCRQYELSRPGILNLNRLSWFQAAKFIRNAIVCVKSLKLGWIKKIDLNLDLAGVYLQKMNEAGK